MNKEQKQEAVKEIGADLAASNAVFAVDYRGISVPQAAELRAKLGEADASFTVVKNRLAKRITAEAGVESLDEHLVGPTALTYVRGDAVIAAKAINDFIKENETLIYKGGVMEGNPLGAEQFNQIARLPGLEVLHGQLVGLAAAPLTGLVSSLNGLIQGLVSQLGQIAEQGLVSGEAPAAEEAAPAPVEDAPAEPPAEEASSAGDEGADEKPEPEDDAPASDEAAGASEEPAADAEPVSPEEDSVPEETETSETPEQSDDSAGSDSPDPGGDETENEED